MSKGNIPDLECLVQTIPGVIYRVDFSSNPDGELIYLNAKIEELCGYSAHEFLSGKIKWFDLLLHEDRRKLKSTLTSISTTDSYKLDYPIKHKTGETRWVLNQGTLLRTEGKLIWSDGVILDITAAKIQEKELAKRQRELNDLITSLDDIILFINSSGYIVNFFAKDLQSLMLPPTAFLNKSIPDAFAKLPHFAQLFEENYRKAIALQKNIEIEYSFDDNEITKWFRARYINLDEPGTVSVLISDITIEKNAALALKKSEQLLRWASETAKIGGWEYSIKTQKLWWADEIYRIRESDKTIEPTLEGAFTYYDDDARPMMAKAVSDAIEHGIAWDLEIPILTAKGNKKWIRDIGIPEMKEGICIGLRGVLKDITEKKIAESQLMEREQELELAIKGADLGTWDWNIVTGSIKVNARIAEMLGYEHSETDLHISIADQLMHPDDKPPVIEKLRTHLMGKNNFYQAEYRLQHKNGQWVWVLDKGRITERNERGKPLRVSGTRLDITDRKLNDLKLQELNKELEQFKLAINTASIVTMADTHGRIKFVNQNFLDITGYTREELIGQKHSIINSGCHSKKFWKDMWRTIGNGEIWRAEVCNRAKSGKLYWVDTFIIPIKDQNSKIIEYISIRNEITQRKKDQERLQLLSMVASQTSNYVIITDNHGFIEWVNESFERATGYQLIEIKGKKPGSFLQGAETDGDAIRHMSDMIKKGKPFSCELINYTKAREKYWVQVTAQPLRNNNGKVTQYFSIMHNITEQKNLVKALEQATVKAVESDRLKSAFLANISHEIRTPMNAIMGFAELLDKPNLSDQKRETFSKLIHARSLDLLTIVNDILDISKIEAGQMRTVPVMGNLAELFDRLVLHFNAETFHLRSKNITLQIINGLQRDQYLVKADFLKLHQVLTNLLTNAAKFTQQGQIELICLLTPPQELLFVVQDTGIGIPADQLEIIFEPFHQATEITHQQYGGSGLGLAICKGLVELWGGRIWAQSTLGHGSAFYFTMPYVPGTQNLAVTQVQNMN